MADEPAACASEFEQLFPAVYLRFHRRDKKRSELPNASRAVLEHLSLSGPLTIGEMAKHLDRAQSVVSEIVDHLEAERMLERMRDSRDRRRVLVWLSDAGLSYLESQRQVLSEELLERAMRRMSAADRSALLHGLRALIAADEAARPLPRKPNQGDDDD